MDDSFEAFTACKLRERHDEVPARNRDATFANEGHEHSFDAGGLLVHHCRKGDTFRVDHGVTSATRFGMEGAVSRSARRN